jgi:alkylhydroperoxidase family enzyme
MRGQRLLHMAEDELFHTRLAKDDGARTDAILKVASAVVRTSGRIDDELLEHATLAGVTDAELAEIVAHVALNTLSNYFNHLAQPVLDFPPAPAPNKGA